MILQDVTEVHVSHDPPKPKKAGELLVWHWHIVNGTHSTHHYPVKNPEEAKKVITTLAEEEVNRESVEANAFGLLISVPFKKETQLDPDFDYEEWEDDETGDDITAVMNNE